VGCNGPEKDKKKETKPSRANGSLLGDLDPFAVMLVSCNAKIKDALENGQINSRLI